MFEIFEEMEKEIDELIRELLTVEHTEKEFDELYNKMVELDSKK